MSTIRNLSLLFLLSGGFYLFLANASSREADMQTAPIALDCRDLLESEFPENAQVELSSFDLCWDAYYWFPPTDREAGIGYVLAYPKQPESPPAEDVRLMFEVLTESEEEMAELLSQHTVIGTTNRSNSVWLDSLLTVESRDEAKAYFEQQYPGFDGRDCRVFTLGYEHDPGAHAATCLQLGCIFLALGGLGLSSLAVLCIMRRMEGTRLQARVEQILQENPSF